MINGMRARRRPMFESSSIPSVWDRINAFNRGRRPELVARKYHEMSRNPFVFFRGTAHLFWEDWRSVGGDALDNAPLAWCCGDLHLENFGSYRGDNGLTYFDINDFDDAALAPATRDIARVITSVHLAGQTLGLSVHATRDLETSFVDSYSAALATGKARWVERAIATGWIRSLLLRVKGRTQRQLLDERTTTQRGHPRFRIDNKRAFPVSAAERRDITTGIVRLAAKEPDPGFYRVLDVVGRIAGLGSLGVPRYAVLVRGPAGAQEQRILDVKAARPSALALHFDSPTADEQSWGTNDAERVVQIQRRMQAIPPALLSRITIGSKQFVIRELQPSQDRLDLAASDGRLARFREAVGTMGELTAWAQLRGASQRGAGGIDALIALGRSKPTRERLIRFARDYANRVHADWEEFRQQPGSGAGATPDVRRTTA